MTVADRTNAIVTQTVTPSPQPHQLGFGPLATLEHRRESIRVNWRLGGTRDGARQSVTFRGSPTARLKLAQAAKAFVEGTTPPAARPTRRSLAPNPSTVSCRRSRCGWKQWLEERARTRDIQPDTITHYRWVLNARVMPRLGHLRLTEITPDVVREWVGWMSSKRITRGSRNMTTPTKLLSASSVHHAHRVLHTCLAGAVPRWIPVNPAALPAGARKHASGLPRPEPFEGRFLTPVEIDLILANCGEHIHNLIFTALATGMRLGELVRSRGAACGASRRPSGGAGSPESEGRRNGGAAEVGEVTPGSSCCRGRRADPAGPRRRQAPTRPGVPGAARWPVDRGQPAQAVLVAGGLGGAAVPGASAVRASVFGQGSAAEAGHR